MTDSTDQTDTITEEDIEQLAHRFQTCQKMLVALGDETRQHVLLSLLAGPCAGSRVVDIVEGTRLSRPAVSHHMQILKNAHLVKSRKEGTCIYYYLDPADDQVAALIELLTDVQRIMRFVPSREQA